MRMNEIILVVGGRGSGKSSFVKGYYTENGKNIPVKNSIFHEYFGKSITKLQPKFNKSIRKGLILDTFDSTSWREFPEFPKIQEYPKIYDYNKIKSWKKGIYRLFEGDIPKLNKIIEKYIWNTVIVYEDATKTVGTRLTDPLRRFMFDSKQKNLDIIMIFHSISAVTLEIGRMPADKLILFKTNEDWEDCKGRIADPEKKVEKAFFELQQEKNRFAYRIIDLRTN